MGQDKQGQDRAENLRSVMARSRPIGPVLQDYTRACECVDWQLSRRFWEQQGPAAFLGGDVPYVVTNDGYLAGNAVAVLLASCEAAQAEGNLEAGIQVLELGAGSGLFAKQFLDQLRASDAPIAEDVYARITYLVTDGSDTMISAIQDHGILAEHSDHIRCLSARTPGIADKLEKTGMTGMTGQFRAVFANYLLDSLPFTILSLSGKKMHELRLRTAIADGVELSQYTSLSEAEVIARFHSDDGDDGYDLTGLDRLYPALVIDTRYDPVARADLPLADTIPDGPGRQSGAHPYLHCFAALACIKEALALLRPDGFMLVSDYGQAKADPEKQAVEFQHFGGSIAVGLNFEAVGRVFDKAGVSEVIVPDCDTEHLLSRLISRHPADKTRDMFRQCYSKEAWDRLTKPLSEAQELVSNGQIEAARWKYEETLRLQPYNWAVLQEIAGFLCYHLGDYEGALTMARETLELNHILPGAWNIVGDCFFYTDNMEEAAEAYDKASQINPRDVRALLNLAWVAERASHPDKALGYIARGLAYDTAGDFREALLSKQEQILARISKKHSEDMVRSLSRIRDHANLPGRSRIKG